MTTTNRRIPVIPESGLWIEMKRVYGGSVSAEQKDWMAYLTQLGYTCLVAKGGEDAKAQIIRWAKETLGS